MYSKKFVPTKSVTLNKAIQYRKDLFKRGHKFSKFLACTRLSAIIIGSNIFVHAGII